LRTSSWSLIFQHLPCHSPIISFSAFLITLFASFPCIIRAFASTFRVFPILWLSSVIRFIFVQLLFWPTFTTTIFAFAAYVTQSFSSYVWSLLSSFNDFSALITWAFSFPVLLYSSLPIFFSWTILLSFLIPLHIYPFVSSLLPSSISPASIFSFFIFMFPAVSIFVSQAKPSTICLFALFFFVIILTVWLFIPSVISFALKIYSKFLINLLDFCFHWVRFLLFRLKFLILVCFLCISSF